VGASARIGGEAVCEGAAGVHPSVPVLFRGIDCRSAHWAKLVSSLKCLKLFMEIRKYCRSIGAGDQEDFAAVFVAADDRNGARRDADQFGDESEQGLVGGRIQRGRCDPDLQLLGSVVADDFITRGAWLNADGQRYALGVFLDVCWQFQSGCHLTLRSARCQVTNGLCCRRENGFMPMGQHGFGIGRCRLHEYDVGRGFVG